MNAVALSLMAFCIGASSASEKTFEEKVEDGYELLKNQPHINETKNLVLELYKIGKEINGQHSIPEENDQELLDETEDNVEIEDDLIEESIEEINQKNRVAITLFQGDMFVTKEQAEEILDGIDENKNYRNKRQALRDKHRNATWSDGVFYYFHTNASNATRRVLTKAVYEWQNDTCIDFYENDTAPHRIAVIEESGCWSDIGRIGGEQYISLDYECYSIRHALHELGHALGFYHTHSRFDRDHYVRYYANNVRSDWEPAFVKENKGTNSNYYLAYDYGSVMHYGAKGSSKNRRPVMIPRDKDYFHTIGSPMISFYDKLMMNMLYKCLGKCGEITPADCQNGGFPHPRNCSKCICPSGYGGRLCHRRPNGCGEKRTATDIFLTIRNKVGKGGSNIRDAFMKCYYWIEAPNGSAIEIVLQSFEKHLAVDGCRYAGVEIKTGSDKRLTGYRFCSPKHNGKTLVSTHNVVPVITYSNSVEVEVVLLYRIAPNSLTDTQPTTDSHCRESRLCPKLVTWGFCNSSKYNGTFMKHVCPRSCGFCPTSPPVP